MTTAHHPYIEGVDYGVLTDADVAMMRHAVTADAVHVDFSEFLEEEDVD